MKPIQIVFLSIFIFLLVVIAVIAILIFISFLRYLKESKTDKKEYYNNLNQSISENSIVFLGDSLTEFYRLDEFFRGYNIYNRGIAGDTTDGVLARLETNVIMMKPDKILLQIGTNDLNEKNDPPYIIENIKKILSILKEKLPNTQLYLISLYPVNYKAIICSPLMVGRRKNSVIMSINEKIKEFAERENITYIDVYSHLLDDEKLLDKKYTIEGLHLSLDGYRAITEVLKEYL